MKNKLYIVKGHSCSGKTYNSVLRCAEKAPYKNVILIGENPYSNKYFYSILEYENRYVNIDSCCHIIDIPNTELYFYNINLHNYKNFYKEIKGANVLLIDDFYTLHYLTLDQEFIDAICEVEEIIVTVADYYLQNVRYNAIDKIKKLGDRHTIYVDFGSTLR